MRGSRKLLIAAGLAGLLLARPAAAHQASMTYLNAFVADDRSRVDLALRVAVPDTAEPLDLPAGTVPSEAHLIAHEQDLFDYVLERIEVDADEQACELVRQWVKVWRGFAEVTWSVRCPRPIDRLAIEYDLFFELDPLHTCNLVVYHLQDHATAPLQVATSRFEWDLRGAPPGEFVPFARSGIGHIIGGPDHVSFLLGLLLVAVILADRSRATLSPSGAYGATTLRLRGVGDAVRYTAVIATSFTIAHSITLIVAAMGWLTLPSRLVESLVAASIVWVAVDNLVRPEPRRRWLLTFAFGLVHGLAFASVLARQLPPDDVIVPLLAFNVGVELGQLAIVLVTVPILHLVATRLRADRYRATVVTFGSAVIGLVGLVWLIERVFAVKILGL